MNEFLAVFLLLLATTSAHHDVHLLHADRFCANVTPEHNILLPSPLDCRIYYKCRNGTAIPQNCPDGLHWCQALTQCLLPAIAKCTIGHVPVTYPPGKEPTLPPLPTHEVTCLEEGASYPDPSNCASYYICKGHKPVKKHCSGKKVFSVLIGSCVEAEVAVCIFDLKPNELCPVNGIRFVNPSDCNSYYECVNNSIKAQECGPELHYNQWFHLCAAEDVAHCQTHSTPGTTVRSTTLKEPVPNQNLCPGNGFTLPNYEDCHSFWRCTGDTFVKDYCPPEFYYSCWDQKCLPSSSAQCEPQTGEPCSTDGQKLSNPQDCHSYYECKNGHVVLEECTNGYEFNGWFSKCVETDRAHCSVVTTTSTVSTTSARTPPPSSTNDICPDDGAKLPDLNDCHSYYVCVTETPQRRQCPLNTIYSCWDQTCLPPSAGVCITNSDQVGQPCSTDNSTLPVVEDCSSYYVCENGLVQEKHCRPGLEYSKWYGKCVTPNLAHCQHPTSQTTGQTDTTTSGTSEPTESTTVSTVTNSSDTTQRPCIKNPTPPRPHPLCLGSDNLTYPEYTHCNQYMQCDCNRQLQTHTCVPPEYHYNCESKKCENITHCCSPITTTEHSTSSSSSETGSSLDSNSVKPGSTSTGEPGHSGSTGSTREPGHSGSTGSTGESEPSGSPTSTGEPGHSSSTGSTGESEPSGPPSSTGTPGNSGSTGSTGESEPSGPPSSTGTPGNTGSTGSTGESEPSGPPSSTGTPGNSGSTGSTGESEPSGLPSSTGTPGNSGSTDSTGESEPSGPPSSTGTPGNSGSTGSTGESEPSGPPSSTGTPGNSGSTGSTGESEPSGPPSSTGTPGNSGSTGSTGESEPSGPPSSTGTPRNSGSTGSTGESEPSGPPSSTGTPGNSGSTDSTGESEPSGPPSSTGTPGNSGSTGSTGESEPSGPPSSTGTPGNSGSTGSTGESEPSGPPSSTGTPGNSGSTGSTGESEPSGPPSSTGTPGNSGSTGSTGESEPSGPPSSTGTPGNSGSTGSTGESEPSGPPSSTGTPGNSGSTGSTGESEPSGPPSSTGTPGNSGSTGSTGESEPSGSPTSTGESGHSVSPLPCHVDHSKPASPLCSGNSSNFKYPAYIDCNAYQVCDCNKQLQKIICDPPEYHYNCETKKCENITHCCAPGASTETSSSTTSTLPPEVPKTCPLGLDGAKLPNPMDCKTYFTCVNGEIVIRPCPSGEMYSCWNQRCESPHDSSCINSPNIAGQNCSKAGQLLPNVANCRGYYECDNGQVQAKLCKNGQMYDSWLELCVEFNASVCRTFPTVTVPPVTGPTLPPTPGPDYNTCPFEGALFPNLLDCNSYYECIGGVPVSQNCLGGYVYSCWDQKCTPANNGTCVNQPAQQGGKCSIDGVRVSSEDCTSYYECENGKINLHNCPKGQQFNAAYLKCYPSKLAHCEANTPLPVTLEPPTTITPDPNSDICPTEGTLLPNPLNCSTYYKCINGTPTLELCVTGYEYSCWDQRCEPAGTAKCISDNPNQNNLTCKYNGQKTQNPEDCHTYYECVNKVVVLKHCPLKMSYNKWFGICLPALLAHCKPTTVPVTGTSATPQPTPPLSPVNDVCPYNGGLIPHPTDCTKYYQCVDHKPVVRSCPSGQEYSCWDLKCKPSGSAECINSGDQTGRNCSLDALHVPDIENCESYYECNKGKVEKNYCFIGFRYNKWYHKCVLLPYAHCTEVHNTPSPTPTPTTTMSTPSIHYDMCPVDGAKFPDLVDCTKYNLCHNNTFDIQSCPDGQSYSCWDQKCEKTGEANCINYGVSQVGANCSIEGLRLSDVQNCSSYYECINGTVTQEDCPVGLQFNYKFQNCYPPNRAHCKVTPTITPAPPTNSQPPVTPNPVNDVCPNEGAMLPNPLNCSTFFKCIKGEPVLQECADGLQYSCWDQRCESPDTANCISQPTTQNCSKPGQRNADPSDCHKYLECVNGIIQSKTCEFNWFYNKWFGLCVPVPDSAHCGPKVTVTPKQPPKSTPVPPGNTDTCPKNGERIADPKDCSQYYECVKGTPTIKKCPPGKIYSYSDEECKKESEAQCINVGSPLGQTCKHEGLRVQNLQSCASYFECINGVIEEQSCLPLFLYNRWYHSCKLALVAHCQLYPTVAPPTTQASAVTTKKYPGLSCSGEGHEVGIKECNKYAVCEKNSVVVHNCRPGTNYDVFSQSCVASESAKCAGNIEKHNGQRCPKDGVTCANPKNCKNYFECKKGKIRKGHCGLFMQYDIWSGKCEVTLLSKCISNLNNV